MVSDAPNPPSGQRSPAALAPLARARRGRPLPWERWKNALLVLAFGLAGFLLVQVPLPGTPGGVWAGALGAAAAACGAWFRLLAVAAGMVVALLLGPAGAAREVGVLLVFSLSQAFLSTATGEGRVGPVWQAMGLATLEAAAGLVGLGFELTWRLTLQALILPGLGMAAGFLLWLPLAGRIGDGPVPRSVGLAVLLVLCTGAFWRWGDGAPQLAWSAAFLLVQVAALAAGAGAGAGMGLGTGALWSWSFGLPPGWAALLGLGGLVGGLLRPLGRLAVLAGSWAGLLLTAPQVADPEVLEHILVSAALASLLSALVPRRLLQRWEEAWVLTPPAVPEAQVRAEVGADLRKVGSLFERIARQLEPDGLASPDEEVGRFIQALHGEACQGCPAHQRCWDRETYATYWEMVELVGVMEGFTEGLSGDGLPRRLALRCTHHDRLLKGIGHTLPRFHAAQEELGRWRRENPLLPEQSRALAQLLDRLATRVEDPAQNAEEVERALRQTLAGLVDLRHLRCLRVGPNRYRVVGQLRGNCPEPGYCEKVIAPLVSRRLGRPYAVWSTSCLESGNSRGCRFELVARRKYGLEVADAGILREGELHSGDSVERTELVDGRVAVVLSDGMGSGMPAWQESRTAVALLRSLLEVGLELHASVRLVNTLLRARSPRVRFATLDMLVVDLYTGDAELLKIGAAPSLVLRGGSVELVEGESPPAGVVDELEADVRVLSLGPDDRVILASDGLWEAGGRLRPNWLVEEATRFRGEDPAVLAEILAARARELRQIGRQDDATVLVARLQPAALPVGRTGGQGR